MAYNIFLSIFIVCFITVPLCMTAPGNGERRLAKVLLDVYERSGGKLVRPVYDTTDTEDVQFSINLIRAEIDTVKQQLKADVWLVHKWVDVLLRWAPGQYDGVTTLRIPIQSIWTPDILLYNSVGRMSVSADVMAVVKYTGEVIYIPPATVEVDCTHNANSTYTCPMKFGSWTYDAFKLDMSFYNNMESADDAEFVPRDWQLVSNTATKNMKHYTCCEEPYADLTFTLEFK